MSLTEIKVFHVPEPIVAGTEDALRQAGQQGYERFVLWSGRTDGTAFHVRTRHVPPQTAYQTPDGLLVRVEGDALHELNRWLYEHEELLGVQVHAHPTAAYHSDTDNTYPIVTTMGGLSIVAANFCQGELLDGRSATYRLSTDGWRRLSRRRLARTIVIGA